MIRRSTVERLASKIIERRDLYRNVVSHSDSDYVRGKIDAYDEVLSILSELRLDVLKEAEDGSSVVS